MNSKAYWIGLDVHKKYWTVCILDEYNTPTHFDITCGDYVSETVNRLISKINQLDIKGDFNSVYEAGPWGFAPHGELNKAGFYNTIVAPHNVPKSSKDLKWKNDKNDAYNLAYFLMHGRLESIYIPLEEEVHLKTLVKTRRTLVNERTRIKVFIKQRAMGFGININSSISLKRATLLLREIEKLECFNPCMKDSIKRWEKLNNQIINLESRIDNYLKSINYQHLYVKLLEIQGVSQFLAADLIAYYGNVSRFPTFNAFKSYSGLVPYQAQSGAVNNLILGKKDYKRPTVRSTYNNAAKSLIQHNPKYKLKYQQYKSTNPKNAFIKVQQAFAKEIYPLWQC